MARSNIQVNVRVALAAVADQNEGQIGVGVQDLFDRAGFEIQWRLLSNAKITQEQRSSRQLVPIHECDQKVVEIPGTLRNIEKRVLCAARSANRKRLIELGSALERQARIRIAYERYP